MVSGRALADPFDQGHAARAGIEPVGEFHIVGQEMAHQRGVEITHVVDDDTRPVGQDSIGRDLSNLRLSR